MSQEPSKDTDPKGLSKGNRLKRAMAWARWHLPPGVRLVLGLILIVGGVFGFLPFLGFWMIPLGVIVASWDVKPLLAKWRGKRRDPQDHP